MSRAAKYIDALDLEEIDDIPFDFNSDLRPAETITLAEVSALYVSGEADASPQLMVVGNSQIGTIADGVFTSEAAGRYVLQRFMGRQAGTVYDLRCVVTLSSGRQLTAAGRVPVVQL